MIVPARYTTQRLNSYDSAMFTDNKMAMVVMKRTITINNMNENGFLHLWKRSKEKQRIHVASYD